MRKHILILFCLTFIAAIGKSQLDVPDPPIFEYASVVPGSSPSQVVLGWEPSDSLDVKGYYIFKVNNEGVTNYLDTVYDRLTVTYTNLASVASGQTETYRLAAFDTLGNISLLTSPHKTMYAFPYYNICELEVNLDWSEYFGWISVESYNVYRRKTGESYVLIANVSGELSEYVDDQLESNVQYCYYIEAIRSDGVKSTSNQTCFFSSSHLAPMYLNADYATVEGANIQLSFTVDTAGEVDFYRLQRADDTPANFATIKTITDVNSVTLTYTDSKVTPDVDKYYYRLQSVDPCSNVSAVSNLASNIILNIDTDTQLGHYLSWTEYENWEGDVQSYSVIKKYGDDNENVISYLSIGSSTYSANISEYVTEKFARSEIIPYQYCYYIIATEDASSNPIGIQGMSKSNEVCVSHAPRIYMPNAFYPNSYNIENRIFKPVISFVKDTGYEFLVFDSWGEEIFKTTSPVEGWDGSTANYEAPSGKYVYFVSYTDVSGKVSQKSGVFLLYCD